MPTITKRIAVEASPEEAWRRLADVGAVDQLLTFLGPVEIDGDRRICSMGPAGELHERILSVDEERRRVAYTIEESPLGFEHHSGSMSVERDGDGGTVVVWIADFLPAELQEQVAPLMERGAASMAGALAAPTAGSGS